MLALAAAGGCSRWDVRSAPVAAAIVEVGDRRARLTLADGRCVHMVAPRVVGDSVVGHEAPQANGARRAAAIPDVVRVETQELDGGRSLGAAGLAAGGVLLAWGLLLALMAGTEGT